jgi:hypothetical protein
MDRQQFDDLARALAAGSATRRHALGLLTGGAGRRRGAVSGRCQRSGQVRWSDKATGQRRSEKRAVPLAWQDVSAQKEERGNIENRRLQALLRELHPSDGKSRTVLRPQRCAVQHHRPLLLGGMYQRYMPRRRHPITTSTGNLRGPGATLSGWLHPERGVSGVLQPW